VTLVTNEDMVDGGLWALVFFGSGAAGGCSGGFIDGGLATRDL
jgi:hypothetical protein